MTAPLSHAPGTPERPAAEAPSGDLRARTLAPDELDQAARLRYAFFVRERGWVRADGSADGAELDAYDPHAVHLGVFRGDTLVGYMRALPADGPVGMMLDRDFRECLTDAEYARIDRRGSVELSRRVIADDLPAPARKATAELLFQLFYVYVRAEGLDHVYLVQEPPYAAMLKRLFGLSFAPLNAAPYRFADGTVVNVDHASADTLLAGLDRSGKREAYERFARGYRR